MWCSPGGFTEVGEHPIQTVEREVLEETGLEVRVTGYVGVWIDRYADDPEDSGADVINVAYYHAIPTGRTAGHVDASEVSELRWFPWDGLPAELAPPETLATVLAATRQAHDAGGTVTTLPDQPR